MKLFAAALALTLGLAGCGPVDGDPIRSGASAPDSVPRQDAVTVAQLRQQAEQNGSLAVVLYLGSVPERTTDVDAALDSLPEQPWQFVTDIPADRWVTAPGVGWLEKTSTPSTGSGLPVPAENWGDQSSVRPVVQ